MGVGFCIPQGGFNFGEEYGLVGSLILYEIQKENNFEQNKFGIYRNDCLVIVEIMSSPIIERLLKQLRKVLNSFD